MPRSLFIFAILGVLNSLSPAHAWDHHQSILIQMMDTNAATQRGYLKMIITVPSEQDQKATIAALAKDLEVNGDKIPLQKPGKITVKDFLTNENYTSIDEPDFGMDQDLPDSADPKNDRAWMGGKTGPTSQGFRHMYFGGMEWLSPFRTLQIPTREIGQAPYRMVKLHAVSREFFAENNIYWGLRVRLWELHLLQDLHQPFHTTQVPYLKMLPWKDLFHQFVARSTQVIGNFHYAYEGLIHESLNEGKLSVLAPCFEVNGASVPFDEEIIKGVLKLSRSKAHDIGVPLYDLWSGELKDPVMDLPQGMGALDYYSYLHANADEEGQKQQVDSIHSIIKTTCELMKSVSQITFSELDQLFEK